MNHTEFKKSICRAGKMPNVTITIEADIDKNATPHEETLYVVDDWGIEAEDCDFCLEWDDLEELVDEGRWESYREDNATIIVMDGKKYRIKFHRLNSFSLQELI